MMFFVKEYSLNPLQQLLNAKFLDATMTQFHFEEMIKSWMDNLAEFVPKDETSCPIYSFRDSFALLEEMLCRFYGLPNCTVFKAEWDPITHHILTIGESFNWAQILSLLLKDII